MTREAASRDTEEIWQEFGDRLRAFITRRVGSAADADDILQEVFLRVHKSAADVHRTDRLTSWLFQVTRNAITDYYRAPVRREQPESATGVSTLEQLEVATSAEEIELDAAQVHEELASCLRPMIERLPPHYQEAVALVDLTGLSQVEGASRLGLSVSGMKSRVQRGRQSLKSVLVECCPVQLDTTGRIVDYDQPGAGCATCAVSGAAVTPVEERGNHGGRCCGPPVPRAVEVQWVDAPAWRLG
jgi:RNA polymerase sigma-70 factor (ECF subfamily)